jgi:hypothetical protein
MEKTIQLISEMFVSVFGVLPALLTIFNLSFANMPGYRPHGSSGAKCYKTIFARNLRIFELR